MMAIMVRSKRFFQFLVVFLWGFYSFPVLSLVEINGEYGLSTQKYGANRNNKIESTSVGAAFALYLFNRTAIELNYSQTETVTEEKNVIAINDTYDLVGQKNNVFIYNYGVGIRQIFAGREARFRPSISLGYARQFIRDTTDARFRNNNTGTEFTVSEAVSKTRYDSVFGSFHLDLRLSKTVALRGSIKTIFKAFEFNRAQDNVQYTVGFSWYL